MCKLFSGLKWEMVSVMFYVGVSIVIHDDLLRVYMCKKICGVSKVFECPRLLCVQGCCVSNDAERLCVKEVLWPSG